MAGGLMANGSPSSVTEASPRASRARIARRVGSASAANVVLRASGVTRRAEFVFNQQVKYNSNAEPVKSPVRVPLEKPADDADVGHEQSRQPDAGTRQRQCSAQPQAMAQRTLAQQDQWDSHQQQEARHTCAEVCDQAPLASMRSRDERKCEQRDADRKREGDGAMEDGESGDGTPGLEARD